MIRIAFSPFAASFNYFDRDRNGTLSREELKLKLRAVVCHKFAERKQALDGEHKKQVYGVIDHILNGVFEKIDLDHSGSIDVEEYVKGFSGNPEVLGFLQTL